MHTHTPQILPQQSPTPADGHAEVELTEMNRGAAQPPADGVVPQFASQPPAPPKELSRGAMRPRLTKVPSSHLAPPSPAGGNGDEAGAPAQPNSTASAFDTDLDDITAVEEDDGAISDEDASERIHGHPSAVNHPTRRSTINVLAGAEAEVAGAESTAIVAGRAVKRSSMSAVL